jgi:hypothetical protein
MANLTRDQLRDEVYGRVGEVSGYFTDTQINLWLADAQEDVALRVEPLIVPATADLVDGQIEYELPTDHIAPHYVLVQHPDTNDWQHPLQLTTYEDLWNTNPTWEDDEAPTASLWYWRDCVIGITPKPEDNITGGLKMIYSRRPTRMTADGNDTGMAAWLDRPVILYAVYRAYAKDKDERRALLAKAEYDEALRVGGQKLHKHTKDTVPRLVPMQRAYRAYYAPRRNRVWMSGD